MPKQYTHSQLRAVVNEGRCPECESVGMVETPSSTGKMFMCQTCEVVLHVVTSNDITEI